MPGKRATPAQRKRFWKLVEQDGLSPRAAAKRVGLSEAWGYRTIQGVERSVGVDEKKMGFQLPDPKGWDELDGGVKDCLRDFNLFSEAFLCRRPAAWRRDAAMRTVEALLDKSRRDFFVDNVFPGSGKTTLFTHDIPAWLAAGGGVLDPGFGRALRFMLGSEALKVATHYVERLRRFLELTRPFYDKEQKRTAELIVVNSFGRFIPLLSQGEERLWRRDQFTVAQLTDVDLYEKEPTVQAASRESDFLGERVDLAVWDDLVTTKNATNPDQSEAVASWFENEAETRVEPGGVLLLVGQRLSTLDLYRNRLDQKWQDDEGEEHSRYHHVVYPAHNEPTCDGDHRQWDLELDGCLLDEHRLGWPDILQLHEKSNFRTVYQQEDADPEAITVLPVWIEGGTDPYDYPAPGCWDRERGFYEIPQNVGPLIHYACVDPSVSGWWAIEWWAVQPESRYRYLIYGTRAKMQAGHFLDWDPNTHQHVGLMEDLQQQSVKLSAPIKVWVIERNAAHRYLMQYEHYRRWRIKYPWVDVIPHDTQKNKADPDFGVEATLRMAYRAGMKRLPRKRGTESLNYMGVKVRELTTHPFAHTEDTVMADWFGEYNLERIIRMGQRGDEHFDPIKASGIKLPEYLSRQRDQLMYAEETT